MSLANFFFDKTQAAQTPMDFLQMFSLLSQSLIMGIILSVISIISSLFIYRFARTLETEDIILQEFILGGANMLLLCVSLTALMIMVDNNLARAFAIGAAVALIRFKGKLTGKTNDTSLLFSVICGMSLGIAQPLLSWLTAFLYLTIQVVIILAVYFSRTK